MTEIVVQKHENTNNATPEDSKAVAAKVNLAVSDLGKPIKALTDNVVIMEEETIIS